MGLYFFETSRSSHCLTPQDLRSQNLDIEILHTLCMTHSMIPIQKDYNINRDNLEYLPWENNKLPKLIITFHTHASPL